MDPRPVPGSNRPYEDPAVEMSSRRTGMSFQRTRMSADRTLMSVIRTSLALISFGFTIHQFFGSLVETKTVAGGVDPSRKFGVGLVVIGILMLLLGIGYHLVFMRELRARREQLYEDGLIHAQSGFPPSLTLIIALLLLLLGGLTASGIAYGVGPFR